MNQLAFWIFKYFSPIPNITFKIIIIHFIHYFIKKIKGKFVYSNDKNSTTLFGLKFWQPFSKKRLKFIFKGKTTCVKTNFLSTKGIKEEKIEIRANQT